MRIGIDIDGVLNYRQEFMVECGSLYCLECGKGHLQNIASSHLGEMYGWDEETVNAFWDKYGVLQMYEWPAQRYAADVIKRLKNDGHEIWIVTGRNQRDDRISGIPSDDWEEVTKMWLQDNKIMYDQITFDLGRPVPHDKGTFCQQYDIEVMIEDAPENLRLLENKTHIFIFDHPYNQDMKLHDSERVYGWYDIYQKLKNLGA